VDTIDGTLRRLAQQYGAEEGAPPRWQPLDAEKSPDEPIPPEMIPDPAELRAAIVVPDLPLTLPAAGRILDSFVDAPLDPWALHLASETSPDALA
jgi:hypothetical protein